MGSTTKKNAPDLAVGGVSTTTLQDTDDVAGFRLFAVGPRFALECKSAASIARDPAARVVLRILSARAKRSLPTGLLPFAVEPIAPSEWCCYFGPAVRRWIDATLARTTSESLVARLTVLAHAYDNGVSLDGHPLPF